MNNISNETKQKCKEVHEILMDLFHQKHFKPSEVIYFTTLISTAVSRTINRMLEEEAQDIYD
jgi:hypothetical protein